MIIKKYLSYTEKDAILLAEKDIGKDAIVMNIKKIQPRGIFKFFMKAKVEITAAVDDNVSYSNKEVVKDNTLPVQKRISKPLIPTEDSKKMELNSKWTTNQNTEKGVTAIEQRLDSLQDMLEKRMQTKQELMHSEDDMNHTKIDKKGIEKNEKIEACKQLVYEQLMQNEVEEVYAKQLIKEIENTIHADTTIDHILANIYQKIVLKFGQSKTIEPQEGQTKYIFFVGPTGVGKTTTIAKIASDLKLNKKIKVALITADTYRIAAVEQLKTYANILGLPLKVIYTSEEIKDNEKDLLQYDIVLVDTAGRSHLSQEHKLDLKQLLEQIDENNREVYLVLSATTKYIDLKGITEAYGSFTKFNLIFTKLDETTCVGNLYNVKLLTDASMSYITCGQNVPDDIGRIDAQKVAKQLLGGNA